MSVNGAILSTLEYVEIFPLKKHNTLFKLISQWGFLWPSHLKFQHSPQQHFISYPLLCFVILITV